MNTCEMSLQLGYKMPNETNTITSKLMIPNTTSYGSSCKMALRIPPRL